MHHSEISPQAYAIGVLAEYSHALTKRAYKSSDSELKAILDRVNISIGILSNGFIDEATFENRLREFSNLQTKALSIIERQKMQIKNLKLEVENLKQNIK
jgi:hypothetical protein